MTFNVGDRVRVREDDLLANEAFDRGATGTVYHVAELTDEQKRTYSDSIVLVNGLFGVPKGYEDYGTEVWVYFDDPFVNARCSHAGYDRRELEPLSE